MIRTRTQRTSDWRAYGVYLLLALLIMLPLMRPGFILTLDMVFTPVLRMPSAVTSSYLFHAALHVLNIFVASDVLEKGLLCSILLLSSIGLHRLLRLLLPAQQTGQWGIYIASIFFAVNPYTYSRFMAGQYAVLLGYALLPWLVHLLITWGRKPDWRGALKLGAMVSLIGTVSIHTLGEVAILMTVAAGIALATRRELVGRYVRYGGVAAAVFALCCGFWLVPLALGHGKTASTIQSFSAADTQAFATTGGSAAGKLGNVLRLQGFWADGRGLYLLPRDQAALWGLMALVIIALVVWGAVAIHRLRPAWTRFFVTTAVVTVALAVGLMSGPLARIGYREPQKFVGLLALSYSVFLACGADAALKWLRSKTETLYAVGAVVLLMLPLLFTRVMLWGFDGQITPRQYPADWSTANNYLDHDKTAFATLMLPWHQYMSFRFAGRIIASPTPDFFDKPVVVSEDPELGGASSQKMDAAHQTIGRLLQSSGTSADFGKQLASSNIKYVLLAKELDYSHYSHLLAAHPELRLTQDFPDIALYSNTAWKGK